MDSMSIAPADTAQASPQTSGCSATLVAQTLISTVTGTQKKHIALVYVQIAKGTCTICRVILDSGSERFSWILVSGISSVKAETTRGLATLHKSLVSMHTIADAAYVLGKIASSLQRDDIDKNPLRIYDGLPKLTNGSNEIIRGQDAPGETSRDCWVIYFVLAKNETDSRRKWM